MSDKSSGTYVIDAEYNVVSYNQTIHELYPQLVRGKKCYKCLMGLDEPCPPCPVAGHIHGPQTYLDPIRGIYETVDAVDIVFENGKEGHALVMSTVGESETIAAKLPRSRDELERLLEQKYFDSLTGGYSRSGFIRQANLLFSRVPKTDYAVVMFNIQNFKAINDVFGVEGGDQVLKTVFETLHAADGVGRCVGNPLARFGNRLESNFHFARFVCDIEDFQEESHVEVRLVHLQ